MDKFKNIDTSQYREVKKGIITRYVKKTDFEKDIENIMPLDGKINSILESKNTEKEKYDTKKAKIEKNTFSNTPNKQKEFYEDLKKRKPNNNPVKQDIQKENKEITTPFYLDRNNYEHPLVQKYTNGDPYDLREVERRIKENKKSRE